MENENENKNTEMNDKEQPNETKNVKYEKSGLSQITELRLSFLIPKRSFVFEIVISGLETVFLGLEMTVSGSQTGVSGC